jgi:hypothetical protein
MPVNTTVLVGEAKGLSVVPVAARVVSWCIGLNAEGGS